MVQQDLLVPQEQLVKLVPQEQLVQPDQLE